MEEKLKYEIKISVYESGNSRIEPIKGINPDHVRSVLDRHSTMLGRSIIMADIFNRLEQQSQLKVSLPTAADIMRTKQ